MKPRGGIRYLLKSSGGSGKSGDRGIRTHADASGNVGHVVKPGTVDSEVKPSSVDSAKEAWIYVRGCRIKRSGLRFNSQGDVYVPDSEDDESGVDLAPAVAANGAAGAHLAPAVVADGVAGVQLTPTVATDGVTGVDVAPAVAADRVAGVEMNPEVAARLAKNVLGEDLHPEVAARLAESLSRIEPFCHEWFIGAYKVMVPLFFTPAP
jgi:hypothetical protein